MFRFYKEMHFFEMTVKVLPDGRLAPGRRFFCLGGNIYRINISEAEHDLKIIICKMTKTIPNSGRVMCKMALLDTKGNDAFVRLGISEFQKETWEFPSMITRKYLQDNIAEYLIGDIITFLCEFQFRGSIGAGEVWDTNEKTVTNIDGFVNLSNDFRSLLSDKSNTDVQLRASDDVEVPAHKSVLVARSPVFSAMFDKEMLENRTGIVKIEDVESNTLKYFLEFLYTGIVKSIDCESATKLLVMADKYQVPNLKEVCVSTLNSILTVVNVCEVLAVADMLSLDVLKTSCLDFAAKFAVEIFSLPDSGNWLKEHPQLLAELLVYVRKKSLL